MATRGTESSMAVAIPVTRFVAPGPGGCDDDAGLSGGSGISVGRVGGALLVSRQNVIYTVTVVIELVINVDGLPAGITEHVGNALFEQHLNQYLSAVH